MTRPQLHHEPIEQRLRDALEARAHTVGPGDLRPAASPIRTGRPLLPARRTVVVLFGLAAAVASLLLVLAERHPTTSVNPADTPSISRSPSPSSSASPSPTSRSSSSRSASPVPLGAAESLSAAVPSSGGPGAGPVEAPGTASPGAATGH
jgi:hypothetical protein